MKARVDRRKFASRLAARSLAEFSADRCSQFAASISYHVLFSIFPLAIVLAGASAIVLHATGLRTEAVDTLVRNVPLSPDGADQLRRLLLGATSKSSALGLVGVVGLVYSASGMMSAIRAGLNEAWDVDERRPFLRGKLVDVGLVFVVATLGLASLGVTIAARFADRIASATGVPGVGWIAWGVGLGAPLLTAFGVLLFVYYVVPAAKVRVRETWPAALLTAVLLVAAENLFALYVGNFANYNAVYGSLGAVIAFMFFVYLAASIFLLGAEVASEWPRVRDALERGEEAPPRVPARTAVRGLWTRRPQATATDAGEVWRDSERREPYEETRRKEAAVLALTEQAAEVIKGIVDDSEAGPAGGLRISGTAEPSGEAALEFSLAPEPVEGDAVVEDGGATVFLDELAAEVLSGKKLDVEAHDDHYHFSLGDQDDAAE
ncbi:MAG TPA: YhjD/YihY/BrkB family envelope integrity protein [Gaiellaceae bacterium]|nr:YhjD/YihY/BrkB family envelope integrity protein [Gaiellaceae bacterium]